VTHLFGRSQFARDKNSRSVFGIEIESFNDSLFTATQDMVAIHNFEYGTSTSIIASILKDRTNGILGILGMTQDRVILPIAFPKEDISQLKFILDIDARDL
jgi:hypothetical protein